MKCALTSLPCFQRTQYNSIPRIYSSLRDELWCGYSYSDAIWG